MSPDGTRALVYQNDVGDLVVDVNSGAVLKTFSPGIAASSWSRDSQHFAFIDGASSWLQIADRNGTVERGWGGGDLYQASATTWSRDDTQVVLTVEGRSDHTVLVDAATGDARILAYHGGAQIEYSPDGATLLLGTIHGPGAILLSASDGSIKWNRLSGSFARFSKRGTIVMTENGGND